MFVISQIRASNLGHLQILDCSFSSLPKSGLMVTGVSSFQVTGCVFSAIQVFILSCTIVSAGRILLFGLFDVVFWMKSLTIWLVPNGIIKIELASARQTNHCCLEEIEIEKKVLLLDIYVFLFFVQNLQKDK